MKQILIVEDDTLLNRTLAYNLASEGYAVSTALNFRTAAAQLEKRRFDLALLDVNLPDGSGYELCRRIKPAQPGTVVIFLTVNDQESDLLRGYEAGAVDYITKPFSIGALLRKIRAMFALLDLQAPGRELYNDGQLFLDFSGQRASLDGAPLAFSPMDWKVLRLFCSHPKQVLTRRQLLEELWDAEGNFVEEHTLTTTVSRIRGKLEAEGDHYIKTIYGMGYQWTGGEKK